MTETWQPTDEPLVLHVIPTPRARGAQREARALADRLDTPGVRAHRVLSLFEGRPEVPVDFSLQFRGGDSAATGFDPRLVLQVRKTLSRFDPAVVVAHGGDPLKYLVPAMAGARRPLAYYAIGTYAAQRQRKAQLWFWRRLVSRVDRVAAEGFEVEDECRSLLGIPDPKLVMTPNGRDPGIFFPREEGKTTEPVTVTFIGALDEGKGPDRFVHVVAALRERGIDARALVVGDGPMAGSLRNPAEASEVELLGSRSDIPELLRGSDVMVFPSRPTGEGMPGVLIEAGLCGIPIVATDVPGVRTIIGDGETGFVVPHDDIGAMTDATERLLSDTTLRSTMGGAARKRCVERFSLDVVAGIWMDRVLSPLLARRRWHSS
jgi:glycosyltransferase involved in cell wall biosynthesis